jgi:hypothetical protein
MSESSLPVIYQLKIVLVGISPMIWRRIKVSSDITIADLHYIIQIVMGWKEEHLHQFLIHGVHYGISYPGTGGFMGNAHEIKLSKFGFREREKFSYEYDFFSHWKHQIRVEAILPDESDQGLPVCTAGKRNCPPEDCGGKIESDNGNTEIVNQVEEWQRDEPLQASNLGLTLAESKQLLKNIQQTVVEEQINQYQQLKSRCSDCDRQLLRKGSHSLTYRTL